MATQFNNENGPTVGPASFEFTPEEQQEIQKIQKLERFTKGTVLFRPGDKLNQYYSVIEGYVRTYNLHDDNEITLGFYTEGYDVSPTVVSSGSLAPSYAICEEDCLLNVTNEQMETALFTRFPRIKELCRLTSERKLIEGQQELIRQKTFSPEQQYLYLQQTRPDLFKRVPQYHIASYLGIKPESLSRLRKRLKSHPVQR